MAKTVKHCGLLLAINNINILQHEGKSYWRAGDLDQGINLEWPTNETKNNLRHLQESQGLNFILCLYS